MSGPSPICLCAGGDLEIIHWLCQHVHNFVLDNSLRLLDNKKVANFVKCQQPFPF